MFGSEFYHGTLRRYVIIFGTLFNEIIISRDNNSDVQQKRFRVPISYGPVQKFLAMIQSNPNLNQKQAITLPRISFEITNISYDPERRLTALVRNTKSISSNDSSLYSNYAPAPYNIDFTMSIMSKYAEDGSKILEQILPYFKPEWTTSVKLVDEISDYYDIPTILTSVSNEEVYEGSFQERQVVMWTLTFTMKGYFFGPVSTKKIIKFANTSIFSNLADGSYSNTAIERVKVYPGLLANGDPADYTSEQTTQATATANVSGGSVNEITLVNRGFGYLSPTITISAPNEGSNTATATANVINDFIVGINITSAGSGYTSDPTITISSPDNVTINYANVNIDDDWDYVVVIEDA